MVRIGGELMGFPSEGFDVKITSAVIEKSVGDKSITLEYIVPYLDIFL